MSSYRKPALSTDQQVELLIRRGMFVSSRLHAQHCLTHISYYRLRAYWLPFEQSVVNSDDHAFTAGTDLATVLRIYEFDRRLRLLLLDAIERVEISLRTQLANVLSLRHDVFAHENSDHFAKASFWQQSLNDLKKEYGRSRETFAEHYRSQYPQLSSPPLWVAVELMTLGHLSRWLQNLRIPKDRQAIADVYGLDEKVLVSFMHHLTIVRNHCAHHGRVWNRKFAVKMIIPCKKPIGLGAQFNLSQERHLYNTLTMLAYLMRVINPLFNWPQQMIELIKATPDINVTSMGFPVGWEKLDLWMDKSL